jgi:exodeoxyribonuclease VII large subunit
VSTLRPQRERLDLLAHRHRAALAERIRAATLALTHASRHWERAATIDFERQRARLARAGERLALLDPQRVLERGYAVIQSASGQVITAPSQLRVNERLTVSLAEGQADVVAREVQLRAG